MNLKELHLNESAVIKSVGGEGSLRQHFLDMGVIPGALVTLIKYAPMGDPIELRIHGYELTLRLADAAKIEIEKIDAFEGKYQKSETEFEQIIEHPGLGEGGKYHVRTGDTEIPKGETLTFALVGNQNCGKTTLFNCLTGANQHVGNFPGVTVDKKTGVIKGFNNTEITDLPGIYSLSPYSEEEIVSREFIIKENPHCIINIVDATNIQRNLYLTMQLMELNRPIVLALNMMDEVNSNGGSVDINMMEERLGIPVVPISAAKNEGVDELLKHAVHIAQHQEKPGRTDFCDKDEAGGAVHRCIHSVMHVIEDHAEKYRIPIRFAASKIIEGDNRILNSLNLDQNEIDTIEHLIKQMEDERGLDRAAAIADMRFSFIKKLCYQTVKKPAESKEYLLSQKIDKIVTGKYTAIPSFIAVIGLVFLLTFNIIGAWLQDLLATLIDFLTEAVSAWLEMLNVSDVVHSLVIDGIFEGVGSVVSFVPIIVVLFFFLSLMEDSGYMARVAFVMDKLLRKIGLSGRSIVPMLIGFGCSVPSIMASRTLPSERDRKLTMILTPFMSCSAKLPIYGFFTALFFPDYAWLIMVALYLLGIVMGIITALVSKNTFFKGEAVPFVMELPNYRMPGIKNVSRLLWDKAKDFLQRAFTVIFIATIIIWFAQTFDFGLNIVSDSQDSILATIAGLFEPVMRPIGLGDWKICTALFTGFLAKESVIATLSVLFGSDAIILSMMSPLVCMSLLIFCLLYTPCAAAIAAVKQELGWKWAVLVVVMQCVIAWICSFIVFNVGSILGL